MPDRLALHSVEILDEFTFRWPADDERFERGWQYSVAVDGRQYQIRHGLGGREVFGRWRVHSVTWVDGKPQVEAAEAEDYEVTGELIGLIKRADGKDVRSVDELPAGYADVPIVVHNEAVIGPRARRSLAVRLREDDLEAWARHALVQYDLRANRRRSRPVLAPRSDSEEPVELALRGGPNDHAAGPPEVTGPLLQPVDPEPIVEALLAHGEAMDEVGPANFAPDPEADALLRSDPFAFLVAVVFDQGVVAERAWSAPWELARRLGHFDPERMVLDPDAVREAIARRPSLHRYVERVPRWVVSAADRVLHVYGGDAGAIWGDEPLAIELQQRLESFAGIGQKKAAMAVEILTRDLKVPIRSLQGSDVAVDVHIRRVFLRAGLAERDEPAHLIDQARRAHPERPGDLDLPAWDIGRRWCRPRDPGCADCPLAEVCPQLVSRADGVR